MTRYDETFRRSLLDMHIPDWDPAFLSEYDPDALAETYAASNVEGVLLYCKSHMGLNYWPAPVGGIHPAAKDRDLVGELVSALRERGISPAAYHSVVFDNWAAEEHPDWRQVSPATLQGAPNQSALGARYGTLCMNNPEYREYELEQIRTLVARYDVDALWIDMVFWTTICICEHCKRRCRDELGFVIPEVIDWSGVEWNRFQAARGRWLDEFWRLIRDAAWKVKPDIAIAHNLFPELLGWYLGATMDEIPNDTFAAGDLYGGREEQLRVSRLMQTVSRTAPAEYMTSRSPDLRYHVQLRSERELLLQALGATSQHVAFLFIDAVDPVGTVRPGTYERIKAVFDVTEQYQPHLGGDPVSDVAIYFSPRNRVAVEQNGAPIWAPTFPKIPYDEAFDGACAGLQAAHIPFAVLTRTTLSELSDYPALILPDVARLDEDEIATFRAYVEGGGRLYASGLTSLVDLDGQRRDDFGLADLFGTHAGDDYGSTVVFLKPEGPEVESAIAPEPYVSWGLAGRSSPGERRTRPLDIVVPSRADATAEVLATVTLPYAYPDAGSLEGHGFASIHSSPPWTDTDSPALVRNRVGKGLVVYSAAPVESGTDVAARTLFTRIILDLIGDRRRLKAEAASTVWVTLFDQPDRNRMVLSALNFEEQPGFIARVSCTAHAPEGRRITGVTRTTDGSAVEATIAPDGGSVEIAGLLIELFEQFAVELEVTA